MYRATYFRCLFAFLFSIDWKPIHKPEEYTTFFEVYVNFLHCFGIKLGVKIDPKTGGFSIAFFQSPSFFSNLEDNRTLAEKIRLITISLSTLETLVGCHLMPETPYSSFIYNKRYSEHLALYGIKAAFNAPGFRSAMQKIEKLCQSRHGGLDKQIAVLNLKQRTIHKTLFQTLSEFDLSSRLLIVIFCYNTDMVWVPA